MAGLKGEAKLPKYIAKMLKEDVLEKSHSTILLSLTDKVLREVVDQTTIVVLWEKLYDKYQNIYLTDGLYRKQHLHILWVTESTQVKDCIGRNICISFW